MEKKSSIWKGWMIGKKCLFGMISHIAVEFLFGKVFKKFLTKARYPNRLLVIYVLTMDYLKP